MLQVNDGKKKRRAKSCLHKNSKMTEEEKAEFNKIFQEKNIEKAKNVLQKSKSMDLENFMLNEEGRLFLLNGLKTKEEELERCLEIIKSLVEKSKNDKIGFEVMYYLWESKHEYKEELFEKLLKLKGIENINSLFLESCEHNHLPIMKKLLEMGADINTIEKSSGDSSLHIISALDEDNQKEVLNFLLSKGANPLLKNNKNHRASDLILDDTLCKLMIEREKRYKEKKRQYSLTYDVPFFTPNEVEKMYIN